MTPHAAQRRRAESCAIESHRDARKPTHRPQANDAAARAAALDVSVTVDSKFLDRGVQGIHRRRWRPEELDEAMVV